MTRSANASHDDDRGNRMSPTHSNKLGVRYRYYVSHAILQKRKAEAGTITRVPAPDIENLVLDGLRKHLALIGEAESPTSMEDRYLIDRCVDRIVIKPEAIEVSLFASNDERAQTDDYDPGADDPDRRQHPLPALVLPWTAPTFDAVKGVLHVPVDAPSIKPATRDAVLQAIAKARSWIDDVVSHRVASFEEIAAREGKAERHIRLLAPLAFVSPRIIVALMDGTAPADLTVTGLAKTLSYSWAEQERQIGLAAR